MSSLEEAQKLVKALSGTVNIFKVGKELFTSAGPDVVKMVHSHGGKVFLDLKFHDIPNTVGAACESAVKLGVFMLNVHASGGKNMMISAVQAVHKTSQEKKITAPLILGVTVLTSMTENDLREVGVKRKLKDQVEALAMLSEKSGLDGVVASGQEIESIRKVTGPKFLVVTPGVRPVWATHQDQKRIVTPREAIAKGANFIVVGRPITQALDPKDAAKKVLGELSN